MWKIYIRPSTSVRVCVQYRQHQLTCIRVSRRTLKYHRGSTIGKGTIHNISMTSNPTDVCHTRKHITNLIVKYILQ